MKTRLSTYASVFLLALAVAYLALHAQFLRMQSPGFKFQAAILPAASRPSQPAIADAEAAMPIAAVPGVPVPVTPVVSDSGANRRSPDSIVPVQVIARQNTLHPGIAYDLYNLGNGALNLRVTLSNPLHMAKIFNCHLEPGKGNYCEIGFDQGFSGNRGDTLTIEAMDYLPLILTPE
jgi:hypothetical protein